MFREDLAWEMIRRMIAGDDKGLTPLEKKQYDRQRASYLNCSMKTARSCTKVRCIMGNLMEKESCISRTG